MLPQKSPTLLNDLARWQLRTLTDLVEYALLVALIALVCVAGIRNVASAVNLVFTNISSSLV